MQHFERIHIAPDPSTERFVSFIDKGSSYYTGAIKELSDLTIGLFLKAACFFRLPKGAFAIIDVYQIKTVDDKGVVDLSHVFDYTVHNSRGTLTPLDRLPEFLEAKDRLLLGELTEKLKPIFGSPDPVEPGEIPPLNCTTVCGGIKRTIPCPDPDGQHAQCNGGPDIYNVTCVNDDAPTDGD